MLASGTALALVSSCFHLHVLLRPETGTVWPFGQGKNVETVIAVGLVIVAPRVVILCGEMGLISRPVLIPDCE